MGGFSVGVKREFLATEGLEDLADLVCVVVDLTHGVLVEVHQFGLLIDNALYFLLCALCNSLIDSSKELSQYINRCKDITILILIHIFGKLILEGNILCP
jgi:hypothetical protein